MKKTNDYLTLSDQENAIYTKAMIERLEIVSIGNEAIKELKKEKQSKQNAT